MIGRILRAEDFERVLGTSSRARSAHFAVHYLAGVPSLPSPSRRRLQACGSPELSTTPAAVNATPVDESLPGGVWVGTVVPKRHARRAVTRTLLKRQIHHAVRQQAEAGGLPLGLWVVRLRTVFDRGVFVSAASDALRDAAAEELGTVMAHAARRARA